MKKAEREALLLEKIRVEKERILHILNESDLYDITLDPLIDAYLDVFEIYQSKYIEWKDKGFPATMRMKNNAGSTNNTKHPLAQQVEVWADKRMKALDLLGLTNKKQQGKKVVAKTTAREDEEIKRPDDPTITDLEAHRNKWRKNKKVGGSK